MELTYIGLSCLRLRGRDVEVVVDPPEAGAARLPKLTPDIVVRTEGRTQPAELRLREGRPQVVSGPGEYELRGVRVNGFAAGDVTVMRVVVDEVCVVAVGRLGRQLEEGVVDALGHVDVLTVPVGGVDAMGATDAVKLVNTVEPFIVVPVRYRLDGLAPEHESVDRFAKEMGLADGWTPQPKLTLTGSSGSSEETRVVILEPRAAQ